MKKLAKKQTGGAKKPVTVNQAKLKDAMADSAMANELSYYIKRFPDVINRDKKMQKLDSIQGVPSKVRKGVITKKMGGTTKKK